MLEIVSPTRVNTIGYEGQRSQLADFLVYRDLKVAHELARLKKKAFWFAQKYGQEKYEDEVQKLKSTLKQSLLNEDENGQTWTYSGLAHKLADRFGDKIENKVVYPDFGMIGWSSEPKHDPRKYQLEALDKLLEAKHGAVEMGTGLGKSFIQELIVKAIGLRTVVMAPSINIAEQLLREFSHHFGKHRVGAFFDGKKEYKKLIVIGVAAGLTKVDPDSEAWEHLSQAQVFIADESHQTPAKTLQNVCFGLLKDAPYRFFFSGTQLRNDGLDLVLDSITGKIVYEMTVAQGVDQGYLAKPIFKMVHVRSPSDRVYSDVNEATRAHLYYNPNVNKIAAEIANKAVSLLNRPTLILVDEIQQFTHLLPFFKHEARFAHGPLNAEQKTKLSEVYHKSDPTQLVKEFNEGKFKILVGTSCVSTGTDFTNVKNIIYLKGGTSEIEVRQGVGRGTRKPLGTDKVDTYFWDFDVINSDKLSSHADARRKVYRDVYDTLTEVKNYV